MEERSQFIIIGAAFAYTTLILTFFVIPNGIAAAENTAELAKRQGPIFNDIPEIKQDVKILLKETAYIKGVIENWVRTGP